MGVLSEHWHQITEMIDRKDLDTPRYFDAADRLKESDTLDAILSEWLMRHTAAEIYHEAQRRRVPFGVVASPSDLLASPHLRERGYFRRVRVGDRWVEIPGLPFAPLGTTQSDAAAPSLGEHNAQVLARAGSVA